MDSEIDIHVWCKQGDADTAPLYTVTIGKRSLCVDAMLHEAARAIHDVLDDIGEAK